MKDSLICILSSDKARKYHMKFKTCKKPEIKIKRQKATLLANYCFQGGGIFVTRNIKKQYGMLLSTDKVER